MAKKGFSNAHKKFQFNRLLIGLSAQQKKSQKGKLRKNLNLAGNFCVMMKLSNIFEYHEILLFVNGNVIHEERPKKE